MNTEELKEALEAGLFLAFADEMLTRTKSVP